MRRALIFVGLLSMPLWGERLGVQVGIALPGSALGQQAKIGQFAEFWVQRQSRWLISGLSMYLSAYEGLGSGRYRVRTGELSSWVGVSSSGGGLFVRLGGGLGMMSRSFLGGEEWGGALSFFGSVGFLGCPVPPVGISVGLSGRIYLSAKPLWVVGWETGVSVPWR